jgi:hypothetical protein
MQANGEGEQSFHHRDSLSRCALHIAQDLVKRPRFFQKPRRLFETEHAAEPVNQYIGPWSYRIDR